MFRALSDIGDEAFSRGTIGFELWIVFCEESSEPTGASEVELFADVMMITIIVKVIEEFYLSGILLTSQLVQYKVNLLKLHI